MGYIRENEPEIWIQIPEPGKKGIQGEKLKRYQRVIILEHRDGYYKIEIPDQNDSSRKTAGSFWLRDTLVSKFPE